MTDDLRDQADATGVQLHTCENCLKITKHRVWTAIEENADISIRKCLDCGTESVARYMAVDDAGGDE